MCVYVRLWARLTLKVAGALDKAGVIVGILKGWGRAFLKLECLNKSSVVVTVAAKETCMRFCMQACMYTE